MTVAQSWAREAHQHNARAHRAMREGRYTTAARARAEAREIRHALRAARHA